jgi:hypothetical protein
LTSSVWLVGIIIFLASAAFRSKSYLSLALSLLLWTTS